LPRQRRNYLSRHIPLSAYGAHPVESAGQPADGTQRHGELRAIGVAGLAVKIDVTARAELQPALEKVEETLGPISILVNNTGIGRARPPAAAGVLDQTPEDCDKVIETNLNACFLLSKLAAQSMVKRREGKIINIRQHVFILWFRVYSFLQRRERSSSTTDQIDGD
jgi:NAD(P)-dependent dehydrogenase (short-subunit alcohol dehydrogenase family)